MRKRTNEAEATSGPALDSFTQFLPPPHTHKLNSSMTTSKPHYHKNPIRIFFGPKASGTFLLISQRTSSSIAGSVQLINKGIHIRSCFPGTLWNSIWVPNSTCAVDEEGPIPHSRPIIHSITLQWPPSAAQCRAVQPPRSLVSQEAPCLRRYFTTSRCPA